MSRNMRFNYLKKKKNSIWKCLLMVIWYLTQEYKQAFFYVYDIFRMQKRPYKTFFANI